MKLSPRFPVVSSERRILLIILDLIAINAALLIFLFPPEFLGIKKIMRSPYDFSLELIYHNINWVLLLSVVWLIFAYALNAYDLRVVSYLSRSLLASIKAGALTVTAYLLIPFISPSLPSSRLSLFSFFIFALIFLVAGRWLYAVSLGRKIFSRRALIVGTGRTGRAIYEAIEKEGGGVYEVVGFVARNPVDNTNVANIKTVAESRGKEICLIKDLSELPAFIHKNKIDTVILASPEEINSETLQTMVDCLELGVEVVPMPVLYEQLTGRVPVEYIDNSWYVALPIDHPGTKFSWNLAKRFVDIILASTGLIFLALATPFIAAAIYLNSPGPIFYRQARVGKGGRIFYVCKFRSMIPNAEKDRPVWAKKNDERVTRVGKILRKTHIDEFPQFINILKGEMSVVGPRPERPEFVEELAREIPFYRVRHAVKPGMAGWGLVRQGYGASKEDALVKLQYDLYYIKHQSPWLDTIILLKTIFNTLTFRGRA